MGFLLCLLLLFLFPLSALATEALPPLVPAGENFADFPDWHIEKRAAYNSVAFSPDGKTLASGSFDKTVKLWEVGSRRLLHSFEGHTDRVLSVTFSPDGKTLASASLDGTVKLWDVGSRRLLHSFVGHTARVNSVTFSPDGKTLASGSWDNSWDNSDNSDKTVKLWEVGSRRLLHSFEGHQGRGLSVTFSPDGKTLASGSWDKTVKLWEVGSRRLLHSFEGHQGRVLSVTFSPDGKTLASGSDDKTVKLWEVGSRRLLHSFEGHTHWVNSVTFSPDGKTLASGSFDKTVKLWEVGSRRLLHSFEGHTHWVNSVTFSPDGKTLASASDDKTVKLWEVGSRRLLHSFEGHTSGGISTVTLSPDGNTLEFSPDSNTLAFSPDGNTLASASEDNTVKLWEVGSRRLLHSFEGHTSWVDSVTFSPDGKTLASGSDDNTVKLWEVGSRRLLHSFEGHTSGGISSVTFSPDGKTLASASEDNTVKLWEVGSRRLLHSFEGHTSWVKSVTFSPDGKTLASGSSDKTVKLWEVGSRRLLHSFEGYTDSVWSVTFSPDGKTLASASLDGTVKLWEVGSRRLLHSFEGHQGRVLSVTFSPDGKTLASGSWDKTVKLWEVGSRRLLHSFEGHTTWVMSVTFSPDGKTLASASSDGTVKLWDVEKQTVLHTLLGGAAGNWMSWDEEQNFQRGDDGTLLMVKQGEDFIPAPPKSAQAVSGQPLQVSWDQQPVVMNSGEPTNITLTATNQGNQPLYWVHPEIDPTASFGLISQPGRHIIQPGQKTTLLVQVGPRLPESPPQPRTDTLHLRVVAPQQTETSIDIPVTVNTPQLELAAATLLEDGKTLSLRVENTGTQPIENTFFDLSVPGIDKFDIQNAKEAIPAKGYLERAFSLPEGFKLPTDAKISLDVRNAALPLMIWDFRDQPVSLPRPAWWMYAALAMLALLSGVGVFYFNRYRNPLLLDLSEQPSHLLRLPPEQLPEARQRLTQTRRLDKVLSDAAVSPQTLQTAIGFPQLEPAEKAQILAQRIGATLLPPSPLAGEGPGMGGSAGGTNTFSLQLPPDFPLNVARLLLFFPGDTPAEDIFTQLKNIPAAQSRITLILGKDSDCQRKLYTTTRDPSNKWVAPQGGDLTRLLLAPDAETTLAEILAGQLALQQISPYQTGGGVYNESVFFGRRELIAQIINRDPANYLLVGGRQVGKSTLLKAIERRYADNPQVQCHYLTLSNEVLIPRLASALKLGKTDDPETFAAQLDEHIRHSGQRYLFLIDEADRFIAEEKAHDYRILNVFRRLSEEGSCHFILAGFWQLYQHAVLDYQSPIRNFGELLLVGALEKPACHDLAVQPMQTMNLRYANSTLVGHLVESCGQRANLIAIASQHMVRNLPPQSRSIEAGDVDKALRSDELRRALAGWSVGESDGEQAYERMVVYATIRLESFTTADLLQLAKQHDLQVDTQELDRTLARLELAFILGRDAGRWSYRVPLFVDYIREDAPEMKLEAELQRLGNTPR